MGKSFVSGDHAIAAYCDVRQQLSSILPQHERSLGEPTIENIREYTHKHNSKQQ
jgi:hypothetical protein